MRVITGSTRGRRLGELKGMETRPTTDKVKESIFNCIQFDVEDARVLDLFAGSGQLGIEALSRGAAYATFTDMSAESVDIVKQNLLATKLGGNAEVLRTEAVTFLKGNRKKYDIIFMDPPYSKGILQDTLPYAVRNVNDGGVIICEHPYGEEMPQTVGNFSVYRDYKYGKIGITVYRNGEEDSR